MVLLVHALRTVKLPFVLLATGVDLFFLLSGFLMVAITDERTRPWSFLKARIFRIVPLYWLMTLIVFGLRCGGASIPFARLASFSAGIPWKHVVASFAFVPWPYPKLGNPNPVLPAGWTLNLEMMFYGLFALALFLPRDRQLVGLTAVFGLIVAAELVFEPHAIPLRAWSNPIIFEFLAGAWIGRAWQKGKSLWPTLIVILLLWIPGYWLGALEIATPRPMLNVVGLGIYALLLVFVLDAERRPGGIPEWAPLRLVGDASYSIYLWQIIPFFAWQWLEEVYGTPPWVFALGLFVSGIAGGIAIHNWVERPLLAKFGRRSFYRRGVPIPGGV